MGLNPNEIYCVENTHNVAEGVLMEFSGMIMFSGKPIHATMQVIEKNGQKILKGILKDFKGKSPVEIQVDNA